MNNNQISENSVSAEINIKDIIDKYLTHWKWFVFGVIITITSTYFILRYSVPKFEVSATILVKDDKKGGLLSELSAFQDLGGITGDKTGNNMDNTIEILKARSLIRRVAEKLQLNVKYSLVGDPIDIEQYPIAPLKINFLEGISSIYKLDTSFLITITSKSNFNILDIKNNIITSKAFGEQVQTSFGKIVITPNNFKIGQKIRVDIIRMDAIADSYKEAISIEATSKTASTINIKLKDVSIEKASTIINTLIDQQNADAVGDKNEVSKNTLEFINDRTKLITAELSDVESDVEAFKTQNKLVDVVSEGGIFLESGSDNQKEIIATNTQIRLAEFMIDYLTKHSDPNELVPSNLGFEDLSIGKLIETYNTLVLERNRISKNSSEKNPIIINLNNQISSLNKSLKESLNNVKSSLTIKSKELDKQENILNSKIASVPKYEREYRNIQRQQQIKEALYLYLLQKREETAITLAVTVANTKTIDSAYSSDKPVSPKKKLFYIVGLLIGLLLPAIIIYILDSLDTKIHSKKDIDILHLPFLGDIPLSENKERLVISKSDNSSISEAFRHLRTNIGFMKGESKSKNRTVFVTSTISKEGKSFIALNLAATIALSGKKVLLIGMDLRAPKIIEYLDIQQNNQIIGLSNYVVDTDINLQDIILPIPGRENFYIMPSGAIPPNPSELLMHERINEMFTYVKSNFDYVIVDTAPVSMVTDTFLISHFADSFIYVARANFLDKRMLNVAEHLYKEKRLPNMAMLVNGTSSRKGYGYGYGYGYGQEKPKSFLEKIFSK